jgi:hypothetical protein
LQRSRRWRQSTREAVAVPGCGLHP